MQSVDLQVCPSSGRMWCGGAGNESYSVPWCSPGSVQPSAMQILPYTNCIAPSEPHADMRKSIIHYELYERIVNNQFHVRLPACPPNLLTIILFCFVLEDCLFCCLWNKIFVPRVCSLLLLLLLQLLQLLLSYLNWSCNDSLYILYINIYRYIWIYIFLFYVLVMIDF